MRKKLVRLLLLAIHACDGMPMPEAALISAVQNLARPEQPTQSDILEALKEAEEQQYASGVSDSFLQERTWTLTALGIHQARKVK